MSQTVGGCARIVVLACILAGTLNGQSASARDGVFPNDGFKLSPLPAPVPVPELSFGVGGGLNESTELHESPVAANAPSGTTVLAEGSQVQSSEVALESSGALIDAGRAFHLPTGRSRSTSRFGTPMITVSAVSYHTHNNDEMNEVNPGVGLGLALTERVDVLAGSFKNSYAKESRYAVGRVRLNEASNPLALHLCAGYVDGYTDSRLAMALDVQYGPLVLLATPNLYHGGVTLALWFLFDGGAWFGR